VTCEDYQKENQYRNQYSERQVSYFVIMQAEQYGHYHKDYASFDNRKNPNVKSLEE